MSQSNLKFKGARFDDLMVEDERERNELIKSVKKIHEATARSELESSDGGSSGRSDTNDLQD